MKYRLIDKTTGIETLCDKVTIDGFNYYVSDEKEQVVLGRFYYEHDNHVPIYSFTECTLPEQYYLPQVIATTNPNIDDVPKVVDEVEMLANIEYPFAFGGIGNIENTLKNHFIKGYNKSQETHPFSEEDVIEFNEWQKSVLFSDNSYWLIEKSDKELLQIWEETRIKVIYYE